jgi:ubiquitin-conjugating enzyme E2 N
MVYFLLVPGVSATPYADNLRYFNVAVAGPPESPYEGIYI